MTQQLSNCCKAQVSVSSGDEGTSCFMCGECKRPCDLFCEKLTPENVREWGENFQTAIDNAKATCDSILGITNKLENEMKEQASVDENVATTRVLNGESWSVVKTEAYERLKRLDENVKDRMEHFKSGKFKLNEADVIYLLKSLYDENTQES